MAKEGQEKMIESLTCATALVPMRAHRLLQHAWEWTLGIVALLILGLIEIGYTLALNWGCHHRLKTVAGALVALLLYNQFRPGHEAGEFNGPIWFVAGVIGGGLLLAGMLILACPAVIVPK